MSTQKIAQALNYPCWAVLSLAHQNITREYRSYVSFLEHRIIRFHPAAKRPICNNTIATTEWLVIFQKYLTDIGCPITILKESFDVKLQWLSGNAMSLYFEDLPKNQQIPSEKETKETKETKEITTETTEIDPNAAKFDNELRGLADAMQMQISTTPFDYMQRLSVVHKLEGSIQRLAAQSHTSTEVITNLTSGLHVESDHVEKAAVVMRMLHCEELRIVQNQINSILETAQEFVSNPKTDSKLGRVGR
tara:strand:- start:3418 stop:4164 length:747 start_codon:yes stop_codon:yes gene_type:complete